MGVPGGKSLCTITLFSFLERTYMLNIWHANILTQTKAITFSPTSAPSLLLSPLPNVNAAETQSNTHPDPPPAQTL